MEIKVEVLEHGEQTREISVKCPDCHHADGFYSSQKEGKVRCWCCGALLKWEVVEDVDK